MGQTVVFLSSTAKDLGPFRDAVYRTVEGLDNHHCVRMEDFGARNHGATAFDRSKVRECDIFVGLIGPFYGSPPPDGDPRSYTEREFDACAPDKPCLMFLTDDSFSVSGSYREPDELWERQQRFRDRVRSSESRLIDRFSNPYELAAKVVMALFNLEQKTPTVRRPEDLTLVLIPRRAVLVHGDPFVFVPGGEFPMGSDDHYAHESPRHRVIVSPFFLASSPLRNRFFSRFVEDTGYPTTARVSGIGLALEDGEWKPVAGADWAHPGGQDTSIEGKVDHPVVQVSWFDAKQYCEWLSRKIGFNVDLPTEAEWEFAAAGPGGRTWATGDDPVGRANLQGHGTSLVGTYPAGEFGLYDMTGNVLEWCRDLYAISWVAAGHTFDGPPVADPRGPKSGDQHVLRGGSWFDIPKHARCAHRFSASPQLSSSNWGFRCRLTIDERLLDWLAGGNRWGMGTGQLASLVRQPK